MTPRDNPRVDRTKHMTDLHPHMMHLFQTLWYSRPQND